MQRSFDDMGTPLHEVTFVVLDLETTGTAPDRCAITEVGAVKVRGGQPLGTFQTLVNPGSPIPPAITYLTGITEAMVLPAPGIGAVLPSLLDFVGDAVVVGHNVGFDLRFLHAALSARSYPALRNTVVDTCSLARRLVRDEVPNCTLATLAAHLRTPHKPSHRALDDALATADVLHGLLERAGNLGVVGLDDLVELPTVHGHPMAAKLRLAARLPRRPGVYLFRDGGGRVLYVGKAADLRRRVRSYFSSENRRKVGQLLRELEAVDHVTCANELEAAVLEVRLIHALSPRFNRHATRWRSYSYLKLTLDERFPRLSVARSPRPGDGCLYLGPLPSARAARLAAEAVESVTRLRRCSLRPGRTARSVPCTPAQLGVAACPCAGEISEADYGLVVDDVVRGLTAEPQRLFHPLDARMRALALAARFEEAAEVRDRAAALARALTRQRRLDAVRRAGRLTVGIGEEGGAVVERGRLLTTWGAGEPGGGEPGGGEPALPLQRLERLPAHLEPVPHAGPLGLVESLEVGPGPAEPVPDTGPLPRHLADEVLCVASWLERQSGDVRLLGCDGDFSWPLPRLPTFQPAGAGHDRSGRTDAPATKGAVASRGGAGPSPPHQPLGASPAIGSARSQPSLTSPGSSSGRPKRSPSGRPKGSSKASSPAAAPSSPTVAAPS